MGALAEQMCTLKQSDRSQINPKIILNDTAISVQLPYIAGHSLLTRFAYKNASANQKPQKSANEK